MYCIQNMISLHQDESAHSGLDLLEAEIIVLGQKEGEIRHDLPPAIVAGLFEFVLIKIAQEFYKQPASFKAPQVIEQCVDLFMNGVAL